MLQLSLWARSLTPEQLRTVESAIVVSRCAAGGFVCRKGTPVEHWIGVVEGLVKMSSASRSGKMVTFTGIPPGGWFGEGSVLKDRFWKYDVIALRDSQIAYMPRATFMALLETSIAFNRFLLEQLNERLGQFIALLEYDRLLDPDARVARCLASLFNPNLYPGLSLSLAISQEELGFLCALSRQRVNQALQVLEQAKLVAVEYGRIDVLDLEGLRQFETP
jgi:CRP/FNR family cyclic AMP-dependent transcriptional regulator